MLVRCEFNPEVDLQTVLEGMSVDISEALLTGVVSDASMSPEDNELQQCGWIQGRVRDAFEAIEAMNRIRASQHKGGSRRDRSSSEPAEPAVADVVNPA